MRECHLIPSLQHEGPNGRDTAFPVRATRIFREEQLGVITIVDADAVTVRIRDNEAQSQFGYFTFSCSSLLIYS